MDRGVVLFNYYRVYKVWFTIYGFSELDGHDFIDFKLTSLFK